MGRKKNRLVLKFKKLSKNAQVPSYAIEGDAAFGLYTVNSGIIKKGEFKVFPLGISVEIPRDYFISFRDRSGLAAKSGIHILGGVIDSGYRGELMVCLINLGKKSYKVLKGEKIAQGILLPAPQAKIIEVKKLSETKRGERGFGSTGRK